MPANSISLSSLIAVFHDFVDSQNVSASLASQSKEVLESIHKMGDTVESLVEKAPLLVNQMSPSTLINPNQLTFEFLSNLSSHQAELSLHEYLLALESNGCSHSTIKNYRSDIKQFIDFSGSHSADALLQKPKVAAFVRYQRQKGLKDSSITRKLKSTAQFGMWAESAGFATGKREWLDELSIEYILSDSTPSTTIPQAKTAASSVVTPKKSTNSEKSASGNQAFSAKNDDSTSSSSDSIILKLPGIFSVFKRKKTTSDSSSDAQSTPQAMHTPHSHQPSQDDTHQLIGRIQREVSRRTRAFLLPYLNLALIILFFLGVGIFGYRQLTSEAVPSLAFPSDPVRPDRVLSFQGRLTDSAQNPITTSTNMRFYLYDADTNGTQLWDSGSCSITPDQDGIFSTGLGDDCGSEISESVFTENSNVWLEVEVASETLTPRQPIRTVAYSLNSETLQGFPISASESATVNTVLVMNEWGEVVLGEVGPTIKSGSGTFSLEGESINIKTVLGSNGDISLSPDGTGGVNINSGLLVEGAVTGRALAVLNETGDQDIFTASASGTTRFVIANDGTTTIGSSTGASSRRLYLYGGAQFYRDDIAFIDLIDSSGDGSTWRLKSDSDTQNGNFSIGTSGGTEVFSIETNAAANSLYINSSGNIGIGTSTITNKLDINGNTGILAQGDLRLYETDNGNYTGFQAPSTLSTDLLLTLPSTAGSSGYVLQTNGSGTLSWVDASSAAGNIWTRSAGTVFTNEYWNDSLLIGGNSTASAGIALDPDGDAYFGGYITLNDGDSTTPSLISNGNSNIGFYTNGIAEAGIIGGSAGQNYLLINGANVSSNVPFRGPVGSAGVPSFSFSSDINSGMFRPTGDAVGFSTGGSEKVRITAEGSLSIGSTSPASLLNVQGTYAGNALVTFNETGNNDIFTASSSGTTRFVIDNNGNVGIGTTALSGKLNVQGSQSQMLQRWFFNNGSSDRYLNITAPTGDGTTPFTFSTNNAYNFMVDSSSALYLSDQGDVGIGTITLSNKLDINGNTGLLAQGDLRLYETDNGNYTGFQAPSTLSTDLLLTLPSTAGASGYVLQTDGSGTLSWVNASSAAGNIWTRTSNAVFTSEYWSDSLLLGGNASSSSDIVLNSNGSAIFNEQGNNADFRIEGTSQSNLFFVDASTNQVSIGGLPKTQSPVTNLLTVNGSALFDNDADENTILRIDSGLTASQSSVITFRSLGTNIWQLRKESTDIFNIRDEVNDLNRLSIDLNGNVSVGYNGGGLGVGTTNIVGKFNLVGSAENGKALAILNETGGNDIFTASSSGTPRFSIANNGYIALNSASLDSTIGANFGIFNNDGLTGAQITANADGDSETVKGLVINTNTGTGELASGDRYATAIELNLGGNSYGDTGYNYVQATYGLDINVDLSRDATAGDSYHSLTAINNASDQYSGNYAYFTGMRNAPLMGGIDSVFRGTWNRIQLDNGNGERQYAFGLQNDILRSGPSDIIYGSLTQDFVSITGGTAYGTYIDIDNENWNSAWSVFVATGSAQSYFGSNLRLGNQADLRLYESDDGNYTGFQAPSTLSTDLLLTLPSTAGSSGYVLQTDGSGTLSWVNASSAAGNIWTRSTGTVYTNQYWNDTLLLGGNSTASAGIALDPDGGAYFGGNVGIGTNNPTVRLQVVGSSDQVQQIVRANSTQTANIFEVQNSSDTNLLWINSEGRIYSDLGSGATNTAFFGGAGNPSVTGADNTAFGQNSLTSVTTGTNNTTIGTSAGNKISSGRDNVVIGENALSVSGSGAEYNVYIGGSSGKFGGDSASYNTHVGYSAGAGAGSDERDYNTSIGANSLQALTTGDRNLAAGWLAGASVSSGSFNTILGSRAGDGLTTGSQNVLIGYLAGDELTTQSNKLYIANTTTTSRYSPLIYGEFDTGFVGINGAGTAKTNLDVLQLTNRANAANMDGTTTALLFNQYYYDATTPAVANAAKILSGTETDWTSTATTQDSYLAFQTALDGTLSEAMRITSAGHVGIGTTSPASKLNIEGTYAGNALVTLNETGSNDIFTASASGTTRLTLDNNGTLQLFTPSSATSALNLGANANKNAPGIGFFDKAVINIDESYNLSSGVGGKIASYATVDATGSFNEFYGYEATSSIDSGDFSYAAESYRVNSYQGTGSISQLEGTYTRTYINSGSSNFVNGVRVLAEAFGTASGGNITGGRFNAQVNGGSGASATEITGLNVGAQAFNGATVPTVRGLYVGNINTGSTNNYAIYTNAGDVSLGDDVTLRAQADVRFADSDSSNYVGFQAPGTVGSNIIWTLPNADATAANQVLASDAAGNLSWIDASAASGNLWTRSSSALYSSQYWNDALLIGGNASSSSDIVFNSNGSAVFNEQGNDADFRIESDTNANAFFLNAGGAINTSGIGIGTSNVDGALDINDGISIYTFGSGWNEITNQQGELDINNPGRTIDFTAGSVRFFSPISTTETISAADGLRVSGIVGGDALTILNDTSGANDIFSASASGTNRFVIKNSGNVGIGTTSPSTELDVRGLVTATWQSGDGNTNPAVYGTGSSFAGAIGVRGEAYEYGFYSDTSRYGIRARGSIAGVYGVGNGSSSYGVYAMGSNVGNAYGLYARNGKYAGYFESTQAPETGGSTLYVNSSYSLYSNPAAIINHSGTGEILSLRKSGSEIFVVENNGDVGIGTTSPNAKLQVDGSAIFNEQGSDVDFRIESLTDTSAFFVDGTNGNIQVGGTGTTPNAKLKVTASGSTTGLIISTNTSANTAFFQSNTTGSYINLQDTNTGASTRVRVGAITDDLVLFAGGLERVRIDANGNLGIRDTSPDADLEINSDAVNSDVLLLTASDGSRLGRFTETSGGAGWFEVDTAAGAANVLFRGDGGDNYISSGYFGIGTTSPVRRLTVEDSAEAVASFKSTGTNSYLDIDTNNTSSAIRFQESGGVNWVAGNYSSDDSFRLATNELGALDRLVINQSGDVAIGTNSASARLHVSKNNGPLPSLGALTALFQSNNVSSTNSFVGIVSGENASAQLRFGDSTDVNMGSVGYDHASDYLTLKTGNTNRLVIESGGNVGIGTSSPNALLEVAGAAIFDNNADSLLNIILDSGSTTTQTTSFTFRDQGVNQWQLQKTAGNAISFYDTSNSRGAFAINQSGDIYANHNAGSFAIGNTSPTYKLDVEQSTDGIVAEFRDNDNTCTVDPDVGVSCSSDLRLKKNINTLSPRDYLDLVNNLNPVTYNFNAESDTEIKKIGFIAQEVEALVPELVSYDGNGYRMVNYANFTPILTAAIQEQQRQIETAQARIDQVAVTASPLYDISEVSLTKTNGSWKVILNSSNTAFTQVAAAAQGLFGSIQTGTLTAYDSVQSAMGRFNRVETQTLVATDEVVSPVIETEFIRIPEKQPGQQLSQLGVLNQQNETVFSIDEAGNATAAGTVTAEKIDTTSARIAKLEGRLAEFEAIKAQTANIVNATISGTLYADTIDGFNDKVAAALEEPTLLSKLIGEKDTATSSASVEETITLVEESGYETPSATISGSIAADYNLTLDDLNLGTEDVTLITDAIFVNQYFNVNGNAFVAESLGVNDMLFVNTGVKVGQNTILQDGTLAFTPTAENRTFSIQPSGEGSISLLADLLVLDESGRATINGDLNVAGDVEVGGTLLTDLLAPTDFTNPLQVKLASASGEVAGAQDVQESRFEIVNELGAPVATISAQGRASFEAGIGVGSETGTTDSTTKTAGVGTITSGTNEVTISATATTQESLIYVTPLGPTGNQVLFVKSKTADDPATPENEAAFTVGFENTVSSDIEFNWWIVN